MRTQRHRSKAISLVLALAVVAGACGGGDDNGADSSAPSGPPQRGGKLVYANTAETPGGWCLPEAELDTHGATVAAAVYDTLTTVNEDGEYVPYLAESVTPNQAQDEWTIKLRSGVVFHDDTPLTAQVVKNNLDAFRGTYPARKPLLFTFVFDNIADVQAADDLTVVVKTKQPWPAFPGYLYFNGRLGIMAQAQLDDAESCDRKLIGTGPFKLKEWVPNSHFATERNPKYWQKGDDDQSLPYLDELEFRPVIESSQRLNGVRAGQYGAAFFNGFSSGRQLAQLEKLGKDGTVEAFLRGELAEVSHVLFNQAKAPFDNPDARKIVALAIDRARVGELRYEGMLPNANGPFAPGNVGYLEDSGYLDFDLDEATKLHDEYEKKTGKPLSFTLFTSPESDSVALTQLLKEMVEKTGAKVTLQNVELAHLIEQALAGEYEAAMWLNHPGGDPDTQYLWWHSQSPLNFGKFQDAEIDRLIDAGRTTLDPEARRDLYEDVNRRLASQVHNAWLHWNVYGLATGEDVHGLVDIELPNGDTSSKSMVAGNVFTRAWIGGR